MILGNIYWNIIWHSTIEYNILYPTYFALILLVSGSNCFDVSLTTKAYAYEVSWSLGSCASLYNTNTGLQYTDNKVFSEQCCLSAGEYTLECKDSYGDGWDGGFVEIQGTRYCDKFLSGFSTTTPITITGNGTRQS